MEITVLCGWRCAKSIAAARICSLSDLEHYSGELGQAGGPFEALKADPVAVAGIDVSKAVEVPMAEGDCVVFNPMCLVSTTLTLRKSEGTEG